MTEKHPEALRWIQGKGEAGSPPSGRCEVGLAGKTDIELLDAYSRAVTTVVEAVGPAVVGISVGRETPEGNGVEPIGAGSGVLLTPDGYVLTNHHVVRDANRVQLSLTDGTILGAVPVGSDPPNDLALVRANVILGGWCGNPRRFESPLRGHLERKGDPGLFSRHRMGKKGVGIDVGN